MGEQRRIFEWDEEKNRINQQKHGVAFEIAVRVFQDPHVVLFIDRVVDGEERWQAIGTVPDSLLFLLVAHTYTEDGSTIITRLISARRATRHERNLYAEAND